MAVNIIVAVDKNLGIGKENKLLAHIKPDLEYFKRVTEGNIVVMGYKTYLSLPNGELPNRKNVVLTRKNIKIDGVEVVNSTEELLDFFNLNKDKKIFIIGGESIYRQFINYAEKLYITHVFSEFEADVYFPEISDEWEVKEVHCDKENINHKYPHIFVVYEKNITSQYFSKSSVF